MVSSKIKNAHTKDMKRRALQLFNRNVNKKHLFRHMYQTLRHDGVNHKTALERAATVVIEKNQKKEIQNVVRELFGANSKAKMMFLNTYDAGRREGATHKNALANAFNSVHIYDEHENAANANLRAGIYFHTNTRKRQMFMAVYEAQRRAGANHETAVAEATSQVLEVHKKYLNNLEEKTSAYKPKKAAMFRAAYNTFRPTMNHDAAIARAKNTVRGPLSSLWRSIPILRRLRS